MVVQRSAWDRVTEMELFVGRLRTVSRLPQYLRVAMLTGAVTVAL